MKWLIFILGKVVSVGRFGFNQPVTRNPLMTFPGERTEIPLCVQRTKTIPKWKRREHFVDQLEKFKTILNGFNKADPRLRPDMNVPTVVRASLQVVGLGPVNDIKQEFTIMVFLRLIWYDHRLRYNDTFENELKLNQDMVSYG